MNVNFGRGGKSGLALGVRAVAFDLVADEALSDGGDPFAHCVDENAVGKTLSDTRRDAVDHFVGELTHQLLARRDHSSIAAFFGGEEGVESVGDVGNGNG
jgi:hypothetical protein